MLARGIRQGMLAAALGLGVAAGALAQVPPLAAEVLAYDGLHQAAWQGDLPKLKALIASGANLDARDPRGRTPLHVAAHARQREAIRLLARAGAQLDLLEDDRYDAVTIAAVADDTATLSLLLSLGASAGQTTSRYDGTALIAAAHLGHDEVVRRLIAAGAPLDHVNNLHWTAVIESIVLGDGGPRHQRTLAALVDAGASLKLTDRQGNTPLQLAKARGYTAMVKLLETPRAR
jgi:ankyrin repeat protein